ncbi:SUKH-3 domain-containing protein [Amycolatopsis sp. NPDC059021]|uniref:SUKH-3 domain-containing protein n=1 Tax=Amycolatopsis sp. NPDC059021 TaxID=3346704 RepID=UPI00366BABF7
MNERPATELLRRGGWKPGRDVSVGEDLRALWEEGHLVFPAAIDFLREYSGLVLTWERDGSPDDVWFSAAAICAQAASGWVADYSARAGTTLVPVGAANRGYLMLLLGENGHWFGGFDDAFGEVGEDLLSCLDNLVLTNRFLREL